MLTRSNLNQYSKRNFKRKISTLKLAGGTYIIYKHGVSLIRKRKYLLTTGSSTVSWQMPHSCSTSPLLAKFPPFGAAAVGEYTTRYGWSTACIFKPEMCKTEGRKSHTPSRRKRVQTYIFY